ncbi:uncharacterized protein COLE_06291 [Cutaneotrichosporon oleaginosum]|uniref:uncharacterized protein n=1 Tax=Cutaneotrichosporon oleaginosum TaxID=879819 RepID=UPI00132176A8|nr:hypothetical protein COLE_06291 [Cutaneotrichosporon oleaginosum]
MHALLTTTGLIAMPNLAPTRPPPPHRRPVLLEARQVALPRRAPAAPSCPPPRILSHPELQVRPSPTTLRPDAPRAHAAARRPLGAEPRSYRGPRLGDPHIPPLQTGEGGARRRCTLADRKERRVRRQRAASRCAAPCPSRRWARLPPRL